MKNTKKTNKITSTIPKTIQEAGSLISLKNKLKTTDLEIQNYVVALEAKNLKYAKQFAKLQVENVSLNNRVKALTKEIEKQGPSLSKIIQSVHKNLFINNLKNHNTSKGLNKKG